MSMKRGGVVEKEGRGIRKRWGFCCQWVESFFFSLFLNFVCVHPCFAKNPVTLTHFGFWARLQGFSFTARCQRYFRYQSLLPNFLALPAVRSTHISK